MIARHLLANPEAGISELKALKKRGI